MMQVIGLTGFAGAGKSTVANYLVEAHGFTRLSFAAPLKKMLRTLNPIMGLNPLAHSAATRVITLEQVFNNSAILDETHLKASKFGDEYRRLLQVLGTDCIRAVDEDFWVKAAVAQMTDPDGKYVFDDVRFPNEAWVIKGYGPEGLWNIHRHGYEAVNGHASEQHAGNMGEDFIITNDRTVEMLHKDIDAALAIALGDVAA